MRHVGGGLGQHVGRVGGDDAAPAQAGEIEMLVADRERGDDPHALGQSVDQRPASSARSLQVSTAVDVLRQADQLVRAVQASVGVEQRVVVAAMPAPRPHRAACV